MPARSKTPGLAWRKQGGKMVAWWLCRQDIAKKGYAIKTQRLWSGDDKPAAQWISQIETQCQKLQGEMLDWHRYWHRAPRGRKGRFASPNFIGSVYFIRCGELIKIGFARDVPRRLAHLQVASPFTFELLATIPGTIIDEAKLHRQFEHCRNRGEWFNPSPDLMEFIYSTTRDRSPSVSLSNELPLNELNQS